MVVEGFDPITEPGLQTEWHKKREGFSLLFFIYLLSIFV